MIALISGIEILTHIEVANRVNISENAHHDVEKNEWAKGVQIWRSVKLVLDKRRFDAQRVVPLASKWRDL